MRPVRASPVAALLLILAGCAGEPLAPLPVQETGPPAAAASAPPRVSAGPPVSPATTTAPTTVPTTRTTTRTADPATPPAAPSTDAVCLGAVRYDLNLQETVLDLVTSMCFSAGGVLRLQGIGPGLVTAEPADLVAQSYEAGVEDLRFLRPGTVTVRVPQNDRIHTIEVVVIE